MGIDFCNSHASYKLHLGIVLVFTPITSSLDMVFSREIHLIAIVITASYFVCKRGS